MDKSSDLRQLLNNHVTVHIRCETLIAPASFGCCKGEAILSQSREGYSPTMKSPSVGTVCVVLQR